MINYNILCLSTIVGANSNAILPSRVLCGETVKVFPDVLDEITRLRYIGKLPESVQGNRRNALIHTFRQYKGLTYVPDSVHPSIRWNKNDPMLDPIADDMPWTLAPKATGSMIKQEADTGRGDQGNSPETPISNKKRKNINPLNEHKTKVRKTQINTNTEEQVSIDTLIPCGTIWHQNSCAYDAILCIVHAMWARNKDQ
jgi:hypothetical protein